MVPDDIKRLRDELSLSLGELADAVGTDVRTVLAWESGDLFPTKRHSVRLVALREAGPQPKPKKKPRAPAPDPLADPRLWAVVRKLVAHPDFLDRAEQLAVEYEDPAG
ncbi:MAG TPA: helix-turn-helix domain-containing protein [Polyangiaceae bacterium]|jgi:transcriptional regulator with XRE-family HTH domain|nr:helix-turn-helix domain-containing protein [Polyangiaceae bacterium]